MSTALDTPVTTTTTGAAPATRAERRAQEEAAALASSKPAIKAAKTARRAATKTAKKEARAARKETLKLPNPYQAGDRARYTQADGTNFAVGEITKVSGRDVYLQYAPGVGFRLDHLDPGLSKVGLI